MWDMVKQKKDTWWLSRDREESIDRSFLDHCVWQTPSDQISNQN